MQMTKAQAVAELERIQELLPLIAEAVKEERKPVNRYAKTSYFKEAYGQSMGTVKNRKYGIMNQIKLGRYPKDAIIDRYIDKAVYADYNRFFKHLEGATRKYVPEYDPVEAMVLVRKMEGREEYELSQLQKKGNTAQREAEVIRVYLTRKKVEKMNQIDMIDIQRRAIQIVDIKRKPRRIEHDDREEKKSAVMTVVAMGLVTFLSIATWVIFGY